MFDQEEYKTFKTSTLAQLSYVLVDNGSFYITTHKEGDNGELLTGWWFGSVALVETAEFLLGLARELMVKESNNNDSSTTD